MSKTVAKIYSAELEGIHARPIEVEVDLNVGLHSFGIVGLADKALNEARERVNSAIKNSGAKPPNRENRRITVNLAPADLKKTGSQYDLAIALGYLLGTIQMKSFDGSDKLFVGELALDGRLRPVNGALSIAQMAKEKKFTFLFLPKENAQEASVVEGLCVIGLTTLSDAIDFLEKKKNIDPTIFLKQDFFTQSFSGTDFSEIKGQSIAKRALTIAAAGGHNMLMIGPPGVGKSLLAQALIGILPRLTLPEAIEVTKIYSAAGINHGGGLIQSRPFRTPHHTASSVAIIGGGGIPRPGEISLAHRGVLFLDELPEFQKAALESLRQPLESGIVHIARAAGTIAFPAKFSLIAAMNPCPCGHHNDPQKQCVCSASEIIRYQKKISGPLMDRIDLQIRVERVDLRELTAIHSSQTVLESPAIANLIETTRERQAARFKKAGITLTANSEMSSRMTEQIAGVSEDGRQFLETLRDSHLSPRGYYRLIKVARTIADLEGKEFIDTDSLAEAYSYRLKEE